MLWVRRVLMSRPLSSDLKISRRRLAASSRPPRTLVSQHCTSSRCSRGCLHVKQTNLKKCRTNVRNEKYTYTTLSIITRNFNKKDIFLYIFWRARVCLPLLCLFRPFCIFERCLDSNPESCRSNQVCHPSPKKKDI
jgi:hypothetical protein